MINIRIAPTGWIEASIENIKALLDATSKPIEEAFDLKEDVKVFVYYRKEGNFTETTLSDKGEFKVGLVACGLCWSSYSYGFSHELCHVLLDPTTPKFKNLYFEEAICHLAAIYSLTKMTDKWTTYCPYECWLSYGDNFKKQINDERIKVDRLIFHKLSSVNIYAKYKGIVESDPYCLESRKIEDIVAFRLADLFLRDNSIWEVVKYLKDIKKENVDDLFLWFTKWIIATPENIRTKTEQIIRHLHNKEQ
jgi:hypothetical protein